VARGAVVRHLCTLEDVPDERRSVPGFRSPLDVDRLASQVAALERLASQARERGHLRSEAVYVERGTEAGHAAALIRDVLKRAQVADDSPAGHDELASLEGRRPRAARSTGTNGPGG